ncbi:hypothetical protein EDD37DRAFT_82269 [Exophiala viscosa]|uniref:uncharacterized protein n=1 Tax=Exophiala viscosa TaxID=2486360 RepID=UPI00219D9CF6|nr:hypothetical protein EDD37DRAFT_82269 [Exophiala viscosa]
MTASLSRTLAVCENLHRELDTHWARPSVHQDRTQVEIKFKQEGTVYRSVAAVSQQCRHHGETKSPLLRMQQKMIIEVPVMVSFGRSDDTAGCRRTISHGVACLVPPKRVWSSWTQLARWSRDFCHGSYNPFGFRHDAGSILRILYGPRQNPTELLPVHVTAVFLIRGCHSGPRPLRPDQSFGVPHRLLKSIGAPLYPRVSRHVPVHPHVKQIRS